jgi:hypothetical protein
LRQIGAVLAGDSGYNGRLQFNSPSLSVQPDLFMPA